MMNIAQLSNVPSLVNPDFMDVCEVLVVKEGNNYMMQQGDIWVKIGKDIIINNMNTRRRRTLIVNLTGGVLDTNMILCEECGIPVLEGYCTECGELAVNN